MLNIWIKIYIFSISILKNFQCRYGEMVYTLHSKCDEVTRVGSSPTSGTLLTNLFFLSRL